MNWHHPFPPGEYGLPHMGAVVTYYRKKRWATQEDFAIVCGVDKQTIAYWEGQVFLKDMERRIFLCKLLKIPPLYLGLTRASITDEKGSLDFAGELKDLAERNIYALYEDILVFARTIPNKYAPDTAYRFRKHQEELEEIVKKASELEKDAWIDLLCRYNQHSTFIAQNHKKDREAMRYADRALELANLLNDTDLIMGSLYRHARILLVQKNPKIAKQDLDEALKQVKKAHNSYKGSTYLLAAEINALYTEGDEKLQLQCRKWFDDALQLAYRDRNDENGTHILFNPYAVHHERAKFLLRLSLFHTSDKELLDLLKLPHRRANIGMLKDAEEALTVAGKQTEMRGLVYLMHLALTEAKLHLLSRDFEESARLGKQALQIAREKYSKQGIEDVRHLYLILHELAPNNPYIVNLGIELGVFPD